MFSRLPVNQARLLLASMLLAVPGVLTGCAEPADLEITDPRIRAIIPGQDKTVGYFNVRNTTGGDIVLTGASSGRIRAIEMHVTLHDGDVARMRRLREVVIPAGETVRFEPGGRHLMLFGVSELGETTTLVLEVQDGEPLVVPFRTITVGEQ